MRTIIPLRHTLAVAAALTVLAAAPRAARAQYASVEGRFGVVNSYGRSRDLLGSGHTLGVGIVSQFEPLLAFRVDYDALTGFPGEHSLNQSAPAMRLDHITAALQSQLIPGRVHGGPLSLTAILGAGATRVAQDGYSGGGVLGLGETPASSRYYPTVTGGLDLGLDLTRTFNVSVGANGYATIASRGDMARYTTPAGVKSFDNFYTIPLTAAVRIRF